MSHYESLLNKTVARYTQTISSNAFGEQVETMVFHESGVKCRLVPVSAEQKTRLPGEFEDVQYTGYFLSSQSLTTDDQVKHNGDFYIIREVYNDSSEYTKRAMLSIL